MSRRYSLLSTVGMVVAACFPGISSTDEASETLIDHIRSLE